jgi:hypothetical protein
MSIPIWVGFERGYIGIFSYKVFKVHKVPKIMLRAQCAGHREERREKRAVRNEKFS